MTHREHKSESDKEVKAEAQRRPFVRRAKPRFHLLRFPDGSERAVRAQSKEKGDEDQAYADFYGVAPELKIGRNMYRIESLISELSARYQVEEQSIAPEILAAAWQDAMGEFIATQTQLISISHATALVRCLHPAVRFELNKRRRNILAQLNKRFGDGSVKQLRLQLG